MMNLKKPVILGIYSVGFLLAALQYTYAVSLTTINKSPQLIKDIANIIDKSSNTDQYDAQTQLCKEGGYFRGRLFTAGKNCIGQRPATLAHLICYNYPEFKGSTCDRKINQALVPYDRESAFNDSISTLKNKNSDLYKLVCTGNETFKMKLPGKLKKLLSYCPKPTPISVEPPASSSIASSEGQTQTPEPEISSPVQEPEITTSTAEPIVEKSNADIVKERIHTFMDEHKTIWRFQTYSDSGEQDNRLTVTDNNGDIYFFNKDTGSFNYAEPGAIPEDVKKKITDRMMYYQDLGNFDSFSDLAADGNRILVKTNSGIYYHFDRKSGDLLTIDDPNEKDLTPSETPAQTKPIQPEKSIKLGEKELGRARLPENPNQPEQKSIENPEEEPEEREVIIHRALIDLEDNNRSTRQRGPYDY